MNRLDAPDSGGVSSNHLDDTSWLCQFFECVYSDHFAHAHASYLIETKRSRFLQRTQWLAEAAEARRYTDSLDEVPPDPVATALVRDMTRFETEGRVVWTGDGWRRPRPRPSHSGPFYPLTEADLLDRFDKVRRTGRGWTARCPSHDDKWPSLSIRRGDRWWLPWCHAGCPTEAVCAAVGLRIADLALQGGDDGR